MIIVAPNLTNVTDCKPPTLYPGKRMNPKTTAKSTSGAGAAIAWSDDRRAAVVEAAYLLDLMRR